MFKPTWARAALTHPVFTGIARQHLADLIAELAGPWTAAHEGALGQRRGHARRRAPGAGPRQRLGFPDRVLVTLVVLRTQLPHQALAVLYRVDRATVTRAVQEVRPLLAARGFAVPDLPGVRLRTLADAVAYAAAHGVQLRIDATETQVRRPAAKRPGRRAFISGKRKQNTIKTTAVCDGQGRTLWAGAVRPGRMHDQTAVKTEGIQDLLRQHPRSRHCRPPRTRRPTQSSRTSRPAPCSPPGGSASNTPSPSTSSGGPCNATWAAATPTPRPTWPSPPWSPTAAPAADPPASRTAQSSLPRSQSRTKS